MINATHTGATKRDSALFFLTLWLQSRRLAGEMLPTLIVQSLLKNPTPHFCVRPPVQNNPIWKALDATRFGGHERKFPEIDFCFHGTIHGVSDSAGYNSPNLRPVGSFHKLGTRYLSRETGRDFVADAIVFGIIVAVSAWPIISMIHALADKAH